MILLGIAAVSSPVDAETIIINSDFLFPNAIAADPNGNVFVIDYYYDEMYEFVATEAYASAHPILQMVNAKGEGVAADASGNLFVAYTADFTGDGSVSKYPLPPQLPGQLIKNGLKQMAGVAIDSSGNVFFAEYGNNAVKEILAPGYTTIKTLGSGFNQPAGVALDASGNVIVTDRSNNAVKKIWAPDYTIVTTIGSGFSSPWGVAVDARDNVFVADTFHGAIKELVAPAYTEIVAFYGAPGAGFSQPRGVAVDAIGNVFVADTYTHSLKEIRAPVLPPKIATAFGAAAIQAIAGTTSLTFTISYPNTGASPGISFTDNLPAGLVVATPNGLANSCGGSASAVAGSSLVSLSGASVTGSAVCTVAVNVQGTTTGVKNNGVQVSSTNAGAGNTSNATLTVSPGPPPPPPPVIAAAFGAPRIPLNSTTSLTLSITNPYAPTAQTGVAFANMLPEGLVVAAPNGLTNTCGGTASAVAGSSSASLSGGTLPAGASCAVSLDVHGATPGVRVDSVEVNADSSTGNTADATLTVASCTHDDTIYCGGFQGATIYTLVPVLSPVGIAVDVSGNVFFTDDNSVKRLLAPAYTTASTVGSGFWYPDGVAVDIDGNVFVADTYNDAVKEILAPDYTTVITLGSGFNHPRGVAVDASGNVFVSDSNNNAVKEILAPGYTTVNTLGSGFDTPKGIAVDASGNVFVADYFHNAVKEILAPAYTTVNTIGGGFSYPSGVALDASGNVYVADKYNNAVKEILAPGYSTAITLGSGFSLPEGIAVDAHGNVFVADWNNGVLKMLLAPGWPPFD